MNEFFPLVVVLFAICVSQGSAIMCFNCSFNPFDNSTSDCAKGADNMVRHLIECPEESNFCTWTNISIQNRNDVDGRISSAEAIIRSCSQEGCSTGPQGVTCNEICGEDECNGSVGHLFALEVILVSMVTGFLTVLSLK